MYIIPAIDIMEGKCVRLTQGDYNQVKVYNEDPVELALQFEGAGIKRLHLVDIDGAKASHIVNYKILEDISANTSLQIDFGGAAKSDEDIRIAFECGAYQITAGSMAVKSPETVFKWLQQYGAEKIILGADVKNNAIAVNGWQENTGLNLFDFLEDYTRAGIQYAICTDVSKDGLLAGPAVQLYKEILERFPELKLIASGGVSDVDDLKQLSEIGLHGAIVGKAIYEGRITLQQLAKLNARL